MEQSNDSVRCIGGYGPCQSREEGIECTGKTSVSTVHSLRLHVVLFTYIMHFQVMMALRTVALVLVR